MALPNNDLQEMDKEIDAWVERTRELTGKECRERQPWNNAASVDSIRQFVYGTDDDNPLYIDAEYAAKSKHGKLLAPPGFLVSVLYPILHGAPMKAPLSSLIAGVSYEWFKRIYVGDQLRATSVQKDFFEKKNSAGRRLNFVISEVTYWNQNDEVVAKASGTMIMASQDGNQLMFDRSPRRYSEQELADLLNTFRNEKRTEADSLYVEDVTVNSEISPIVRGPLTIGDMVCWNAGAGPSYKAGRWGFLDLQKGLHGAVKNPVTGFLQKNSQQHEDFNLASGRGMPAPFDNGVMRFAWVAPLITNWMGDDGFLQKLDVQVARPGLYGDITTYSAKIVEKDVATGTVKLQITGTNQEGELNTKGSAEVILPKKS